MRVRTYIAPALTRAYGRRAEGVREACTEVEMKEACVGKGYTVAEVSGYLRVC